MAKSRAASAPKDIEEGQAIIDAWRTNNRVTTYLIENLPPELWSKNVPGVPRPRFERSRLTFTTQGACGSK